MTEDEAPIVSFRCLPDILERIDRLVESDKIKYVNRSSVIKMAVRKYLQREEARQSQSTVKEVKE